MNIFRQRRAEKKFPAAVDYFRSPLSNKTSYENLFTSPSFSPVLRYLEARSLLRNLRSELAERRRMFYFYRRAKRLRPREALYLSQRHVHTFGTRGRASLL